MKKLTFLFVMMTGFSCTNYYDYPTYSEDKNVFMVVENPAGTNDNYSYNHSTNKFEEEVLEDDPQRVAFLPYPANFGFIPSTRGNDEEDQLKVIGIGSNIKRGSILEIIPVGVLYYTAGNLNEEVILGVIVNSEVKSIDCKSLQCLQENHPGIIEILELWFKNHEPEMNIYGISWKDEKTASETISKWSR